MPASIISTDLPNGHLSDTETSTFRSHTSLLSNGDHVHVTIPALSDQATSDAGLATSQRLQQTIPELGIFDQDDLNNNPIFNPTQPVPLIGALLIEAKQISQDQLNAGLMMQDQDFPELPIGQILLRCGYVSQEAIDQVLDKQMDHRLALMAIPEEQAQSHKQLTGLILHPYSDQLASGLLSRLGVRMTSVKDWATLQNELKYHEYDLVLIDENQCDDTAVLPNPAIPLLVLPSTLFADQRIFRLPRWGKALITQFVAQVRIQGRQRDAQERLYQRETQLSTVATMSQTMASASTSHHTLTQLMMTIRDLFGVEAGTLYRFDQHAKQLVFEVVLGPHQEALYQERLPIDRGIAGWVVRNRESLLIHDVRQDSRFEDSFDAREGFQTRSVLCVPLIARGQIYGVIQLINKLNGAFNQRDQVLLCILASIASLAKAAD